MPSFPTFLVSSDVEQFLKSDSPLATANVLWVSKSGDNDTGTRGRFDKPFLTVEAAEARAESGDVIRTLQGSYASETIGGKDGVFYDFMEGSIGPAFNVTTPITISGKGLCQRLTCDEEGAVMDMPMMNAVGFIRCIGGTQTAGNAGTFIACSGGAQTIRLADQSHNDRPIRLSASGNLRLFGNSSESTEENGVVVSNANNWSGNLFIQGLTIKALNAGTNRATKGILFGTGVTGKVTLKDCTIITAQGDIDAIVVEGAGTAAANGLYERDGEVNGKARYRLVGGSSTETIRWAAQNEWRIQNNLYNSNEDVDTPDLVTTWNVGTGTAPVPTVRKATVEDLPESLRAKSIDAPEPRTVYVMGTLNTTHPVGSNITLVGGAISTQEDYV